jgi:hypothetical protein
MRIDWAFARGTVLDRHRHEPQRALLGAPSPSAPLGAGKSSTELKRLASRRGRLEVVLIEARSLALPSNLLHSFCTLVGRARAPSTDSA